MSWHIITRSIRGNSHHDVRTVAHMRRHGGTDEHHALIDGKHDVYPACAEDACLSKTLM